jgi:tetratricopeptide (TPR) repeat protein
MGVAYAAWGSALAAEGRDPTSKLTLAIEILKSYVGARSQKSLALSKVYGVKARWELVQGRDPEHDCREALELLQGMEKGVLALLISSEVWGLRAISEIMKGRDPRSAYRRAIQEIMEIRDGEECDPQGGRYMVLASLYMDWAVWARQSGQDCKPLYMSALESLSSQLEEASGGCQAFYIRGMIYERLASVREEEGSDPEPWYKLTIDSFEQALRIDPGHLKASMNLGMTLLNYGYSMSVKHQGADELYERGLKISEGLIQRRPGWGPAVALKGYLLTRMGRFSEGLSVLEEAGRLIPDDPEVRRFLDWHRERETSPSEDLPTEVHDDL